MRSHSNKVAPAYKTLSPWRDFSRRRHIQRTVEKFRPGAPRSRTVIQGLGSYVQLETRHDCMGSALFWVFGIGLIVVDREPDTQSPNNHYGVLLSDAAHHVTIQNNNSRTNRRHDRFGDGADPQYSEGFSDTSDRATRSPRSGAPTVEPVLTAPATSLKSRPAEQHRPPTGCCWKGHFQRSGLDRFHREATRGGPEQRELELARGHRAQLDEHHAVGRSLRERRSMNQHQ